MKRLSMLLLVGLTSACLLTGCGKSEDNAEPTSVITEETIPEAENTDETEVETETEAVEEEVAPEGKVRSDLTNEWIDEEIADRRPIAVMIPNDKSALPHYSISEADVLYQANVEGSMTRLMAIFKDWRDMDRLGNVRSARDYYIYWSFEWDAILCHYGGPYYIDDLVARSDTNNINGVKDGSSAFFRSTDRSAPQNAYLTTDGITKAAERSGYDLNYRTNGYYDGQQHFKFVSESNQNTLDQYSDASDATYIDMSKCYPVDKTYFKYNADDGLYYRYEYDAAHTDAGNSEQLAFKNVLVQFTYSEKRDEKGYLAFQCHDNTRDGYYFTNGKAIHVNWEKNGDYKPTVYYDDNGNEIELNTGKTMICIVRDGDTFSYSVK